MSRPSSRILPAFIDDNYFSLMPGESKTVTIEFHHEDTGGRNPIIEISGWNIASHTLAG
ncbi:MAG: glycoside hydrolase family 2 protein [Phycisphaerae bacterium]